MVVFAAAVLLLGAFSLLSPTSFWRENFLEIRLPPQVLFVVMMVVVIMIMIVIMVVVVMRVVLVVVAQNKDRCAVDGQAADVAEHQGEIRIHGKIPEIAQPLALGITVAKNVRSGYQSAVVVAPLGGLARLQMIMGRIAERR